MVQVRSVKHMGAMGAILLALCGALPALAQVAAVQTHVVATGLESPWAVGFLPEGRFLITERPGRLLVLNSQGARVSTVAGVPDVALVGQGGLLDVAVDSQFASNRTIYLCFGEPGSQPRTNRTALARAQLSANYAQLEKVQVIFRQQPAVESGHHFGCRIAEAPDGTLFLSLGDRFSRRDDAQKLDSHLGKVVRIGKDGSVPQGNPFVGRAGALPEIYSYGHRNSQGATMGPDGRLWMHEHGPQGGDEINRPQPGKNYGWPVITFGEEYGSGKIGEGTQKAGMEPPVHYWVPSIAPSGMAFVTSDRYGAGWKGNLLVGALKGRHLARLETQDGKVTAEHKLLTNLGARIRDVRQGPDGYVYLLTDGPDGKLVRLLP